MALPSGGPYSGTSALSTVLRFSAFTYGVVYGSIKLSYLRNKYAAAAKAAAKQQQQHH